ncbi:MAG: sodium:solute symporter [Proteobacteria bacterium]|nr:sodium:solute symporter [Pseudomonadota bacterium]
MHRHGGGLANPIAGIYFGIFAACLGAGVVLLLIFEQLGVTEQTLKISMAVVGLLLFSSIGAAAYTSRIREFLLAGRRIPAIYNGLIMAVAVPGGAGIAGLAGCMFLIGFDSLCIGVGMVAGFTVSVMLIAPYLRKFGSPTLSGYLGERFDSKSVRILAASVTVVPLMLASVAEIKVAIASTTLLTPLSPFQAALVIAVVLAATIAPGGVRSNSWSAAAQSLAVLIAVLLPAAIAAVIETNLPFGQVSHGPLMRAVGRGEALLNVPVPVASLMAFDIPGQGLQAIAGRFGTTFGSIGPVAFVFATLATMAGVAASPSILSRAVTTPSVFEARKSLGWAVVLASILLMTFSAIAVFERDLILNLLATSNGSRLPQTLQRLVDFGLAGLDGKPLKLLPTSLLYDRDGMLIALPVLMGMPLAVVNLVAAGVLAAALAGASLSLTQIGIIVGEDVVHGPDSWRRTDNMRLLVCRGAICAATLLAAFCAVAIGGDPLQLLLHALAISGSALFPVLVLSIWWKRVNAAGAFAGLAAGFAVAVLEIGVTDLFSVSMPPLLAPVLAIPASIGAAAALTELTQSPGRHILELVRELRIPGGETIHDREVRQARQRASSTR